MRLGMVGVLVATLLWSSPTVAQDRGGSGTRSVSQVVRIGLSPNTLQGVNRNDVAAALRAWTIGIAREQQLAMEGEILLLDTRNDILSAMAEGRVDGLQLSTNEFPDIGLAIDSVFLSANGAGIGVQYVVVTHAESGIRELAGLVGHAITLPQTRSMNVAQPWFEMSLAEATGRRDLVLWERSQDPSRAVFEVFFRQRIGAVVTRAAFDLAGELNPQLLRDLVIIAESPNLVPDLFILHPEWATPLRRSVGDAVRDLHLTETGKQVLLVFQTERMEVHPISALETTLRLLRRHTELFSPAEP